MLNRRHIRRSAGFQRISGRPLRASNLDIRLKDFQLEAMDVYNNHYEDNYITSIYNEIQNYVTEGKTFDPYQIMEYVQEISEKTGLQYKILVPVGGDANIKIYLHKGSGFEISIAFRAEAIRSGLTKLCVAMENLF